MRVVIDNNCFLAIISKVSRYCPIFDAFRQGKFELAVGAQNPLAKWDVDWFCPQWV